jgi:hypothetical protein
MYPYKGLFDSLLSDIAGAGVVSPGAPISSDMELQEVRCQMLYRSFYKKLEPEGMSNDANAKALEKFKTLNANIATCPFEFPIESEQDSVFWDYFRDNILKCMRPSDETFDLEYIRQKFTAGPGSSLKCVNDSFYTKLFNSRITTTHEYLLALYRAAIIESDTWSLAEKQRDDKFGHEIVSGNRLFFVPKTAEISRSCCTEPLVNMLIQQALGAFLESCLAKSFGVSLKTQPDFNRELARIGSLDGSFGTIDLQSASDSISMSLVRRIVPGNLLGYFELSRSRSTILPDGSEMDLNMISTMGNGFTFPLQTVIFACVIRSVYQMMSLDSHCPRTQFGVFGDDIIVRKDAYAFVVRSLTKLGFQVNDDKSFNSGSFRESCGHDWYAGHFVRGVYIRSLETVSDVYSAINRLNRWSALAGVRLSKTIGFLRLSLKRELLIPFSESIDGGIQVPFNQTVPKVDNAYWFKYRVLAKRARKLKVPETKEDSVILGYKDFNPYGWAVTFLGGYARREDYHLKSEQDGSLESLSCKYPSAFVTPRDLDGGGRTKVIRKSIPYWDWLGPERSDKVDRYKYDAYIDDPFRLFSYGAWEGAVAANRSV